MSSVMRSNGRMLRRKNVTMTSVMIANDTQRPVGDCSKLFTFTGVKGEGQRRSTLVLLEDGVDHRPDLSLLLFGFGARSSVNKYN